MNWWLPVTRVWGTNSLQLESSPDRGDFEPLELEAGEVARFWGNQCRHGTVLNETGATRVSLDFRVVSDVDFDPNASVSQLGPRLRVSALCPTWARLLLLRLCPPPLQIGRRPDGSQRFALGGYYRRSRPYPGAETSAGPAAGPSTEGPARVDANAKLLRGSPKLVFAAALPSRVPPWVGASEPGRDSASTGLSTGLSTGRVRGQEASGEPLGWAVARALPFLLPGFATNRPGGGCGEGGGLGPLALARAMRNAAAASPALYRAVAAEAEAAAAEAAAAEAAVSGGGAEGGAEGGAGTSSASVWASLLASSSERSSVALGGGGLQRAGRVWRDWKAWRLAGLKGRCARGEGGEEAAGDYPSPRPGCSGCSRPGRAEDREPGGEDQSQGKGANGLQRLVDPRAAAVLETELSSAARRGEMASFAHPGARAGYTLKHLCRYLYK